MSRQAGGSNGVGDQAPILAKARGILEEHKLEITKVWLSRLVGGIDDLRTLEGFPLQESVRTSVSLLQGLTDCLADEAAADEFKEGGLYYEQAANLASLQPNEVDAMRGLSDGLCTLEDTIWERLSMGMRQQDRDLLELVRRLHLGLHCIMAAAAQSFHDRSSAELDRMAHTDSLTSLYNRRYFDPELERHVELYRRYGHPFAILMLDLDNLKWVNDTFGHMAGDTALKHLAAVMRSNVRDVDIPCRYGGDEFLILMPEANRDAIQFVGRRIAESVNKSRLKLNTAFAPLRVSYGAAACPEDGTDVETLLRVVDANLYRAKQTKQDVSSRKTASRGGMHQHPGPAGPA